MSRVNALERTVAEQGQMITEQCSMINSLICMHESLHCDVMQCHPSFPLPPMHPLIRNSGSSLAPSSNGMIVKRDASSDDVWMVVVRAAKDMNEADEGRSTDAIDAVEGVETSMVVKVVNIFNVVDFPENSNIAEGIEGGTNVGSIESAKATKSVKGAVIDRVIDDTDVGVNSVVGDVNGEGTAQNDPEEQKIEESEHSYTPPSTPPMVSIFLNHDMVLTPLSVANQKFD